jgi:hypothetical protein
MGTKCIQLLERRQWMKRKKLLSGIPHRTNQRCPSLLAISIGHRTFSIPRSVSTIFSAHGGPGGLICCASCTASYTKHLTKTAIDMETQKMQKVGDEVNELIEFTRSAKQTLAHTIKVARRKPVPTRRNTASRTDPSRATTTARNAPPQVVPVVGAQQVPPVVGPQHIGLHVRVADTCLNSIIP